MTMQLNSTTDSPEAVTAALGDLASKKPAVETTPAEETTEEETEAEADAEVEEGEEVEEESEEAAGSESEEESDSEEEESDPEVDEEEEAEEVKPKKKGGFQKRIDKLSKAKSDAERDRDHWREVALAGKKTPEETKTTTEEVPEIAVRPKAEDFEKHDDYVEALTDWKLDQKLAAKERERQVETVKTEAAKRWDAHQSRMNTFRESHPDIDEALQNVAKTKISLPLNELIIESDLGAEIVYELAKNPKEFERLCKLSPLAVGKEVGKLEAKLSKTSTTTMVIPKTSERKISTAKPVTPLRTRGSNAIDKDISNPKLTQKEYDKLRDEQLKQSMRR